MIVTAKVNVVSKHEDTFEDSKTGDLKPFYYAWVMQNGQEPERMKVKKDDFINIVTGEQVAVIKIYKGFAYLVGPAKEQKTA